MRVREDINRIAGDVRALFNQDPNVILGRNRAGTLRLTEDERSAAQSLDNPRPQLPFGFSEGFKKAKREETEQGRLL
ncbi:MAG: HK97 family phage prohead protease [Rhodoplanes sp.]